jgi:NTE family protein
VTSVVLGAGGERVVGWEVGVLAGLLDAGLDLRGASRIIGTSAGALVAVRLAAGIDPRADAARHARRRATGSTPVSFAPLAGAWVAAGGTITNRRRALGRLAVANSPGGGEAFAARIAMLLPDEWPPALRIVAIDADSGERVVFAADSGVPLAHAVAASRAVPGLLPPVTIGERRFIDGALGSATNADLAGPGAVVIAPFPQVISGGVEGLWSEALQAELERLPGALVIDAGPADSDAMDAGTPAAVAAGRARAAQMSPRRAA